MKQKIIKCLSVPSILILAFIVLYYLSLKRVLDLSLQVLYSIMKIDISATEHKQILLLSLWYFLPLYLSIFIFSLTVILRLVIG